MALSKHVVYGAVDNELRCPSLVATTSPAVIWNPATCLSPSEQRRSRPPDATAPHFRYRQTGSDATQQPGCSSMLSELLGFGAATRSVALAAPAEVVLAPPRQRHCSYAGADTPAVVSTNSTFGSGVNTDGDHAHSRSASESRSRDDFVAGALDYCIRSDTGAQQQPEVVFRRVPGRIWRPVESCAAARRPRWVAVDKGDVCSLVDNLVTTMIASDERTTAAALGASEDRSVDVRDASTSPAATTTTQQPRASLSSPSCKRSGAMHVSSRCAVAASEPRKWKSDLLQRMRNEHT